MWGKKEDSTETATPAPEPKRTPTPAAAPAPAPAKRAEAAPSASGAAQIGKSVKFKGTITGAEDLVIDGEVEGTVELNDNHLTVGPNGIVRAQVKARSVTILGLVEGPVHAAERTEIRKSGTLEGDLVTARISVEEGAVFRGSVDILRPDDKGLTKS